MARRRWHSIALAVILALAVPLAPVTRSVRATCDVCPTGCPMHRKAKPSCHRGAAPEMKAERHCGRTPGLARPGCGRSDQVIEVSLPPAILAAPVSTRPVVTASVLHVPPRRFGARGNDPPDTPPPVFS